MELLNKPFFVGFITTFPIQLFFLFFFCLAGWKLELCEVPEHTISKILLSVPGTRWRRPYSLENGDREVKWLWRTLEKGWIYPQTGISGDIALDNNVCQCELWNPEREEFPVPHLALSTCLICLIILQPPESTLFPAFIAKHSLPCNRAVPNEMKCN